MDTLKKTCTCCGVEKGVTQFYKHKGGKYGVAAACSSCSSEKYKAWRSNNPDKAREIGYSWLARNIDKRKAYERARYQEQKERLLALNKIWKSNNLDRRCVSEAKRRAAKRGAVGQFTFEQIGKLLQYQKRKCACCGIEIDGGYHIDHIFPLSRGGSNEISNIQLLCATCNLRKGAKDPIEYANEIGRLL